MRQIVSSSHVNKILLVSAIKIKPPICWFLVILNMYAFGEEPISQENRAPTDSTNAPSAMVDSLQSPEETFFSAGIEPKNYLLNYVKIPANVFVSLFQFDNPQKNRMKAVFTGALVLSFAIDQPVRDVVQDRLYSGSNVVTEGLRHAGNRKYVFPGFAAAYGLSLALQKRYHHDSVLLAFQALVITQLFTEVTKYSAGRVRPRNSMDDPFLRERGGVSFFSGHASGAWAVMTVVAGRYDRLKWGAYGLAAAIAAARIYEDAHWTSDVLMGSLAGYGIATVTLRLNDAVSESVVVTPYVDRDKGGVVVHYRF